MSGVDRRLKPENYEAARARWAVVAHVVADHEGVSISAVRFAGGGETRAGAGLIRARRLSCYLAQVAAELSGHELANVSKLSRKTIREHVQAIEDARDDQWLSAELDALTAEIQLVLARRAYAAQRLGARIAREAGAVAARQPAAPAPPPDPVLDAMLAAMARAEDARATWKRLCEATERDLAALEAAQAVTLLDGVVAVACEEGAA